MMASVINVAVPKVGTLLIFALLAYQRYEGDDANDPLYETF